MRRSRELDAKRGRKLLTALLRRVGSLLGRRSNALLGEERDGRRSADSPKTLSVPGDEPVQSLASPVRAKPPADWLARVSSHPPPADWLAQVQDKIFVSRTVHQADAMDGAAQTPPTIEAQSFSTLPPHAVMENFLHQPEKLTPNARGAANAPGKPAPSMPHTAGTSPRGSIAVVTDETLSVQSHEMANGFVPTSNSSLDQVPTEPTARTAQTPSAEFSHARVEPVVKDVVFERPVTALPNLPGGELIGEPAQIHVLPQPPVTQSDRAESVGPEQDFPPAWASLLAFADTLMNTVSKSIAVQPLTEFPPEQAALEQEISTRLEVFVPERGQADKRGEPAQVMVQTESVRVAPPEGWVPFPNAEDEVQDSEQARREWERRARIDREQRGS